jgi:hypothetical protein
MMVAETTLTFSDQTPLLGKDRARSDKVWRNLLGFALVDPAGAILPLRTAFQDAADKDDGKASINVGLAEIEHGPAIGDAMAPSCARATRAARRAGSAIAVMKSLSQSRMTTAILCLAQKRSAASVMTPPHPVMTMALGLTARGS